MEGAGLLHCSLNNSIKKQKLQSKWGGIKAPRLCHRAPAASASSTSAPRLSSHCLCSHVLLLPSTQPSLYLKGHLLPHDTSTPSKSSLLRHLPTAQSFVQKQITPRSLLLLTAAVQHMVQMGRRHQMWVTLSPVLRGRSDAGIWPSALHSSCPSCVQFPSLFSKDIWTL